MAVDFREKCFFGQITKSLTKIEYANGDNLLAQSVEKIRLSYLKEDGSPSTITINDILYVPKAKVNLLSLGQLSKQGVDMKTTGAKIILSMKKKTVMTGLRIGCV